MPPRDDGTLIEWDRPQPAARLHYGPIAEDLHAISPDLVTDVQGQLGTDLRDLLGIEWKAIEELADLFDGLQRRVDELERKRAKV